MAYNSFKDKYGVLDISYARGREKSKALKYRLWRRTYEVLEAIKEYAENPVKDIIDLGTADGRMLHTVFEKYSDAHCVGVEYNQDLVTFAKKSYPHLEILQGDIQALVFTENSFDVAIATAVIEHLPEPGRAMREIRRILRPGGIVVLTSPDPFWEAIATLVGHLPNEQHNQVMKLKEICLLTADSGLEILKTKKFMLSPIGMPFEFAVEKFLRLCHFDFLMANNLVIARCGNVK